MHKKIKFIHMKIHKAVATQLLLLVQICTKAFVGYGFGGMGRGIGGEGRSPPKLKRGPQHYFPGAGSGAMHLHTEALCQVAFLL